MGEKKNNVSLKEDQGVVDRLKLVVSKIIGKDAKNSDFIALIKGRTTKVQITNKNLERNFYGWVRLSNYGEILQILANEKVNLNWLFTGCGSMFIKDEDIAGSAVSVVKSTDENVPVAVTSFGKERNKQNIIVLLPRSIIELPTGSILVMMSDGNLKKTLDISEQNIAVVNTAVKEIDENRSVYLFKSKGSESGYKFKILKMKLNQKDYMSIDDNGEESDTLASFYDSFEIVGRVDNVIYAKNMLE